MKFTTETGSVYEYNQDSQMIRRLSGQGDCTPRIGKDGVYKPGKIKDLVIGEPAIIIWGDDVSPLDDDCLVAAKLTVTSKVVSVTY